MKRRRFDEATPAATETLSLPRREPLCLSLSLFFSQSRSTIDQTAIERSSDRFGRPDQEMDLPFFFPLTFLFIFSFFGFRFAGGGGWGVPFGPAPSAL